MVSRNDIVWADAGPPVGRRPVCILTRDAAIPLLHAVTCAPITTTIRGIRSEVSLGPEHGLDRSCVINCDNLLTLRMDVIDSAPIGSLDAAARASLDRALRYSLDIRA